MVANECGVDALFLKEMPDQLDNTTKINYINFFIEHIRIEKDQLIKEAFLLYPVIEKPFE